MIDLESVYRQRHDSVLRPLTERLYDLLQTYFNSMPRIDRISTRPKSVSRFVAKAEKLLNGQPKYTDPLNQIQDQIGARIVTFYVADVSIVAAEVEKYFRPIESKVIVPDSESEFGYFGKHFILFLPSDIFDSTVTREMAPSFFELQIKTLFQHAWSEAEHDLGYKPSAALTPDQKRRIAFTAAQAWGADRIFNELHAETIV
jgi:ppGpp synthetase/RelA/SpoT-type nucleotidyltranferase